EALLRCFRFDVVVTDLSVSGLGGLEGMRLIRFITTHFPDITVYVLSGFVDERVRALCSALGVTAVLEKPGGLSELRDLLLERREAVIGHGNAENAAAEALRPGEVQKVELLEDFLAANTIGSVLQPVVRLQPGSDYEIFGVEGLARGPAASVLGSPA